MADQPAKISIIVPVYNAAATLPRAFSSILEQTIGFDNLDVWLVDDCSTDGSMELVKQYADEYANVHMLQTSSNSGTAGAPRNLALEKIGTEYVMFLDNDDAMCPNACRALYDEAERSGADLVTGYYHNVDEHGKPIDERAPTCMINVKRKEYHFPEDYASIYEVRQGGWCKIYRTAIIKEHKLQFATECYMEDILFIAQYLLASKTMVYIDELVYAYTERESSLTHIRSTKYLLRHAKSYMELWEIFSSAGQPICFDQEFYRQADFYINQIFTSPYIANTEERLALLKAWQPLVKLTLERGLYIADDQQRSLFELIAAGEYNTACMEYPCYLIRRLTTDLNNTGARLHELETHLNNTSARMLQLEGDLNRTSARMLQLEGDLNRTSAALTQLNSAPAVVACRKLKLLS